jgi:hypothetical protein
MKTLDIAAILKKNPQVDADLIEQHIKKSAKDASPYLPRVGINISPYNGRRLVLDEGMDREAEAVGVHRAVFGRR